MLKNAHVSRVIYHEDKQICEIYMENGDYLCGSELSDRRKLEEYLRMLREEDDLILPAPNKWEYRAAEKKKLRVQCFGNFEVFSNQLPVYFERKGSKEILAYLIDKRGASVSRAEICTAIWEDSDIDRRKEYFRTLIKSLKKTLKQYGEDGLFISHRDAYAINMSRIDCDYYRYLAGDPDKSVRFRGEYMSQYSWAESTLGQLIDESGIGY